MLLRVAGINHFDPLGRQKLQRWLIQYAHQKPGPLFLATEWDRNIFATVRGQRQHFRELAAQRWPHFSNELLDTLALSLGYEADSHMDSFPNTEMLWLDQGRDVDQEDVNAYAEGRVGLYAGLVNRNPHLIDMQEVLAAMSEAADQIAAGDNGLGARDQRWTQLILDKVANDRWGIVIVGKRHTADEEGSVRRHLEDGHQECEVTLL